ncbi:bifunctional diaminohydroxyphosphoribosylaminopyrimidine deaminase/5-amino-6-(5-phosphoribosylamino)uracil reductase RibD [Rarispira pelagica]
MHRALSLASRAMGMTSPNPMVGAVVVKDGRIVGEGFHRRAGLPHAEVEALLEAGNAARGATVYVTLEPCCHYGKTPPCTSALIDAGVKRVVVAARDPNPKVAGRGIKILREAGIDVRTGVLEKESRWLNRGFMSRMERGRPWVMAKIAMGLDGRIALPDGSSRWITGEDARHEVMRLRAWYDVVLTGAGTVIADDPQLTVRLPAHERQPLRVVLDGMGRLDAGYRVAESGTIVFSGKVADKANIAALKNKGVECIFYEGERIPPSFVLNTLLEKGVNTVMIEAGQGVISSFAGEDLIDELVVFVAPRVLGKGLSWIDVRLDNPLSSVPAWRLLDNRTVGEDVMLHYVKRAYGE